MLSSSLPAGHQGSGTPTGCGKARTELALTGQPQRRVWGFLSRFLAALPPRGTGGELSGITLVGVCIPNQVEPVGNRLPGSYLLMARTANTVGSMQPMDLGLG